MTEPTTPPDSPPSEPRSNWVTVEYVAAHFRVSPKCIRKLIRRGDLKAYTIGDTKLIRIKLEDMEAVPQLVTGKYISAAQRDRQEAAQERAADRATRRAEDGWRDA